MLTLQYVPGVALEVLLVHASSSPPRGFRDALSLVAFPGTSLVVSVQAGFSYRSSFQLDEGVVTYPQWTSQLHREALAGLDMRMALPVAKAVCFELSFMHLGAPTMFFHPSDLAINVQSGLWCEHTRTTYMVCKADIEQVLREVWQRRVLN